MSEVKVNKVSPRTGTDVTLGDSGDTFTVPSGATLTTTSATVNLPATTTVSTELKTNKISPASGTAFTLGDSGDTFTIPAGATITNSGTASGFGGGSYTLLQTQTVSSGVSAVNFTSNIDSTYKNYMIQITECHPADDGQRFNFRLYSSEGSPDIGSAYMYGGIGKRSDNTATDHNSTGTTAGQITCDPVGNANAESFSAIIRLYNPSGTTFYKNIDIDAVVMNASGQVIMNRSANNYNETVAYTGISFFFESGNIDAGVFKLYGIS